MYQIVDTLMSMNQFSASAISIAFVAAIICVWLRSVAHRRGTPAIDRARSHSFWCALIAFFASTSWDLSETWRVSMTETNSGSAIAEALTPGIWVLLVYLIGLFTWPKELQPVRTASLEARSLTTPFPKALGAFVGLLLLIAVGSLWPASKVEGLVGVPASEFTTFDFDGIHSYTSEGPYDGRLPGTQMLPVFIVALAGIIVAAAVITVVILKRPALAGISVEDNQALRTVWLNRLMRNIGIVLLAFTVSVVNYSQANSPDGQYEFVSYGALAVALTLLFWGPRSTFSAQSTTRERTAFSRLRDQLFTLQYVTAALTLLSVAIGWSFLPLDDELQMPTNERTTWILMIFAGAALSYAVLNALYLSYVSTVARQASAAPKYHAPLPLWSYIAAGLLFATSTYFLLDPPLDYLWGFVPPGKTMVAGLILLLLATHLGFVWFSRRAIIPWAVSSAEEIWYRKVLELRSMRVNTSAVVAMLLIGYGFPAGLGLFALLIFVVPAVIFLERPGSAFVREHQPAATS
ncbi:hypothetical protein [Glutamicibacter sp. NPDC087673]|uniref:hypothetical protein n=1 Tax=Glutamicibacter sp. NPDC087673 TaxID=3363997 RepID=UPI0038128026